MTAKEAARKAGKWTALVVPTVAVLSLLLAQGFCVAPWEQMSKADAAEAHSRIEERVARQEDRITARLDELSTNVYRIMGALQVAPAVRR